MEFKEWMKHKRNLSAGTIKMYSSVIKRYKGFDLSESGYLKFVEGVKDNSRRAYLFALMCYFDYMVDLNKMESNFLRTFKPPRAKSVIRRFVSKYELEIMLENYYEDNQNRQDRIKQSMELMFYLGLRSSELLMINTFAIDNGYITLIGKGDKMRTVPIATHLINKYGSNLEKINLDRISKVGYSTLRDDIRKVCKKVGLKEFSPHAFRHGYASYLLNNGIDLLTISKVLGHSSLDTTAIYLHMSPQNIKQKITAII